MLISRNLVLVLGVISVFTGCFKSASDSLQPPARLRVAAASNLQQVLPNLLKEFEKTEQDIEIEVVYGASGVLATQIQEGASFDVFLSADTRYPLILKESESRSSASLFTYAQGRLCVLFPAESAVKGTLNFEDIDWSTCRIISMANPTIAPYGIAASEVASEILALQNVRVAMSPNVSGVVHAVQTGAADAGFTALPLVKNQKPLGGEFYIAVPLERHSPILQSGICLTDQHGATELRDFMLGDKAQELLVADGYASLYQVD